VRFCTSYTPRCRGRVCFRDLSDSNRTLQGVSHLKLHILFFGLACSASLAMAQQDPSAFISAGRGLELMPPKYWEPGPNTSISGGYRIAPGFLLCGYVDFNSSSFLGDESPSNTGSFSLTSFFLGAKAYATIPGNRASPYFFGAVGSTKATSDQDTVYTHHHGYLLVSSVYRGTAVTFLGAVGSDIRIYKGMFCFGEIRVSARLQTVVFGLSMMGRAGIGFNFY